MYIIIISLKHSQLPQADFCFSMPFQPPPPPTRSSSRPPLPSRNYGPEETDPRYGPAPGKSNVNPPRSVMF